MHRTRWTGLGAVMLGALLAAQACGDSGSDLGANGSGAPTRGGTNPAGAPTAGVGGFGNTGGGTQNDAEGPTSPADLPPEMEVKLDFELPQASDRFVYAANPDGGTVAIIDAETLAIQTLETGERPTFLRTLAGTDDAIVLNVGSDDATIMRSPGSGAKTSNVSVVRGANAIAVAPDGKHAVVYFDAAYSAAGGTSGSFQDVTVIDLDEAAGDTPIGMTVGFRPRDVFFASDGSAAYVVTDDGVSVLDFADIDSKGSGIARLVSLGTDIDQTSLDVSVTPDGSYALARQPGESAVRLVDLASQEIKKLDLAELPLPTPGTDEDAGVAMPLPVEVSDLDLSPDGSFALAVLRNQSAVLKIPVPAAFEDPSEVRVFAVPDQLIGLADITPDAKRALLYTTVAPVERITILSLDGEDPPKTVALRKTVQAVAIAPDGQTALIVHSKADGDPNEPGIDSDTKIDRSYGYSVLRVSTGDVKLQVTPVPARAFTIVPDSGYLFLLFRDDATAVREIQKVDAKSFLVQPIKLGSPPISLGSVAGSERVFVNQDHPDGRITLIDWKTNETRTVTGFELNSRIRD